jgi:hypothetical protein
MLGRQLSSTAGPVPDEGKLAGARIAGVTSAPSAAPFAEGESRRADGATGGSREA